MDIRYPTIQKLIIPKKQGYLFLWDNFKTLYKEKIIPNLLQNLNPESRN